MPTFNKIWPLVLCTWLSSIGANLQAQPALLCRESQLSNQRMAEFQIQQLRIMKRLALQTSLITGRNQILGNQIATLNHKMESSTPISQTSKRQLMSEVIQLQINQAELEFDIIELQNYFTEYDRRFGKIYTNLGSIAKSASQELVHQQIETEHSILLRTKLTLIQYMVVGKERVQTLRKLLKLVS